MGCKGFQPYDDTAGVTECTSGFLSFFLLLLLLHTSLRTLSGTVWSTPDTRRCSMAATLHKHKTSNVDEVAVVDLEEGLFCLHVEAAALLSPSFKQTARRGSLMRKPSGKSSHTSSAECVPAFLRSHILAHLERGVCFLSAFGASHCAHVQGRPAELHVQLVCILHVSAVRSETWYIVATVCPG